MMKRNILAVITPALLVARAVNIVEVYSKDGSKVDVYGKAVGLHYFSKHNGDSIYTANGDQIYTCLGFKGEIRINDQLTGYGQWEYQPSGNNAEGGGDAQKGNKTCLMFAGLEFGDVGSFGHGRNYGAVCDVLGYTDMLPESGGDTAASDQFFSQRNGGLATYRNSSFFDLVEGLNLAVQYLGKNERSNSPTCPNGNGVDGSVDYEMDGFGIVGAYGVADRTSAQGQLACGRGAKVEQWATGVKYDANNIYPAANYSEIRNATCIFSGYANKTEDALLVAQYQFDFGLRPSLAYTKSKGKDIEGIGNVDLVNYFEVGVTHYFNKNMSTYVDYITNQIDSDNKLGVDSDDIVAVDIVYQF